MTPLTPVLLANPSPLVSRSSHLLSHLPTSCQYLLLSFCKYLLNTYFGSNIFEMCQQKSILINFLYSISTFYHHWILWCPWNTRSFYVFDFPCKHFPSLWLVNISYPLRFLWVIILPLKKSPLPPNELNASLFWLCFHHILDVFYFRIWCPHGTRLQFCSVLWG